MVVIVIKSCDTGYMNAQDIIPEHAGVRGPQSESILYPHGLKKGVASLSGHQSSSGFGFRYDLFQVGRLREEANFFHEDIFNVLVKSLSDVSQSHRLLQLKCVKDWVGWREGKDILGKRCSNALKGVIIEDFINNVCFVVSGCCHGRSIS